MSRIRLDVEQMLHIANKYQQQSAVIDEVIIKLDQMLIELQTYWEGASATKFEQNYYQLKPSIIKMRDVVLETSNAIKYSAQTISDVDNVIFR